MTTKTEYQYYDYFNRKWRKCQCDILKQGEKTTTIRLCTYGPHGSKPGTIMRVLNKSIVSNMLIQQNTNWKSYSYYE